MNRDSTELILDKLNCLTKRLDTIEKNINTIDKNIDTIKKNIEYLTKGNDKMLNHISFIENVYDTIKSPFYFILNKIKPIENLPIKQTLLPPSSQSP